LGEEDRRVFYQLIAGINSIAYTLGLGYVFITRGPVFRVLMRLARGERIGPPPSDQLVSRALTFGSAIAVITRHAMGALWICDPGLDPAGGWAGEQNGGQEYQHFFISNQLCGLIAATQTYYMVTYLTIRYCYPWLLQARPTDARDVQQLAGVARRGRIFLALTVSVPFLALFALVGINFNRIVMAVWAALGSSVAVWPTCSIWRFVPTWALWPPRLTPAANRRWATT